MMNNIWLIENNTAWKKIVFALLLTLIGASAAWAQCSPIKFAPGRTSAVVNGKLNEDHYACYQIHARAGQRMTVHVTSPSKRVRFSIGADSSVEYFSDAKVVADWEGELTDNSGAGNFQIAMTGPQAGATFTLEVSIAATRNSAGFKPSTCGDFSGVYQTDYGPLRLTRTGNQVRGSYRSEQGGNSTVAGTVQGSVLSGTWIEPDGKGTFRFELNSDGRGFTGSFKNQGDRNVAGDWNGHCSGDRSH